MVTSYRAHEDDDNEKSSAMTTFDGIFGMGSDANGTSFLQRAAALGYINSTAWSYEPGEGGSGSMLLGGYNLTQIKTELAWLFSGNGTASWNYTMSSLAIDDTVVFSDPTNSTVTFTTSYKGVGVPAVVFDDICSTLQGMNADATSPIECSH